MNISLTHKRCFTQVNKNAVQNSINLLVLMIIFNLNTLANGGPVDGSAVYRTGDIVMMEYSDIKLQKETLNIRLEGDYSIINVKYHLKNNGYSKTDVTYGFPIDIVRDELISYKTEWQKEYVPNIEFKADGRKLPIKQQLDYSIFKDNNLDKRGNPITYRRNWYVVDFSIDKDDTLILNVNYKVKNGFSDWETSKTFFETYSTRELIYDFSPAQNWGNGIIDTLTVEVDASAIIDNAGEVLFKGMKFSQNKGKFINKTANFNLKKCEELAISYNIENEKYSNYLQKRRIPVTELKNIEVSSELEGNYSKHNLFDNDFNTTWAEGVVGSGIGEKIKIQLDDMHLLGICLINGYTKNSQTYKSNNRIKRVRIEKEYVSFIDDITPIIDTVEIDVKDLPYRNININNFYSLSSTLIDFGEGCSKVSNITITILEVYPGEKYDDTCISELFLMGYKWDD